MTTPEYTPPDAGGSASPDSAGELGRGFVSALGANVLFGGIVPGLLAAVASGSLELLAAFAMFVAFGIGLSQALWLTPMVLRARQNGQHARAKGMLLMAAITLLLNGGCFGVLLTADWNFHSRWRATRSACSRRSAERPCPREVRHQRLIQRIRAGRVRCAQDGRRMVRDEHFGARRVGERAPEVGLHTEAPPEESLPGGGAQAHHHTRPHQRELGREPGPAGLHVAPLWLHVQAAFALGAIAEVLHGVGHVEARA